MIASLKEVIAISRKDARAVGSFNTPNLECLLAVLGAAEKLNVPVIIAHAQCHESVSPIQKIGPVMVELAKRASVPVCVHLDHGEDFDYCKQAIALGFTSVMIDYSTLPYEDNVKGTAEVAAYAHARGVDVEAELGAPVLNLDIIDEVRKKTDIPLVMHGGSGISHEVYRDVIRRGINKINYYTYMSYAGYAAAKELTQTNPTGFFHDMALTAQKAMEENALTTLKVFSNL